MNPGLPLTVSHQLSATFWENIFQSRQNHMTRSSNWQKSVQKWRDGLLQVKESAYTCEEIQSSWQTNWQVEDFGKSEVLYSHYNAQLSPISYMRLWGSVTDWGNLNLITSCIAIYCMKTSCYVNITSFYCYSCCYTLATAIPFPNSER
jgi:hypothetical protein